ncbi:MAG: hypothetical protein J5I93_21300, partial [Pirellulaceae bacterium]|nr:hypothetical protein [Pirellulaceae bacterium]
VADRIEIWLLRELLRKPARQRLGPELHEAVARMLADPQARRAARLRAVALSWREFQDSSGRSAPASLGGYHRPPSSADRGTLARLWLEQRRVGVVVADLWELGQRGTDAADSERLRRIASFWGAPESDYGFGPLGPYRRADDLDRFLDPPLSYPMRSVANQWQADWEHTAARHFGGSQDDAR